METIRSKAKERMQGYCRVCPVCNGKACAGEVPGMGGLGTAQAFIANIQALDAVRLVMRTLHEVKQPDTSVRILGLDLALPVLAAPIGGVAFNMGGAISEQDYVDAVLEGCKKAGTIGCTGDGVPDFFPKVFHEKITAHKGHGIPFIKPWEEQELTDKLKLAQETGASVVGMDVDACGLVTLAAMGRPVSPKSAAELARIIADTPMRFIVKGIMTPEDARLAVEAGAHGIVVSNHGGRVLDKTPGTAEVLPAIARAVKGHVALLADGGIRSGADILKMLALGADAVMVGRPISVAAIGGGAQGVEKYLRTLHTELTAAMILTGTARASAVSTECVC